MPQQLSKWGLSYAPEVCESCINGEHCAHVVDELADFVVLERVHIRGSDKRAVKYYTFSGYAEAGDNFWLKRILEYAYISTRDLPDEKE